MLAPLVLALFTSVSYALESNCVWNVTTFAGGGGGFADGLGTTAKFQAPQKISVDASSGILYVTDNTNQRVRMVTPGGVTSTLAGNGAGPFSDGIGSNAKFNAPLGIALDNSGTLYIADSANFRVRTVNATSKNVATPYGSGTKNLADGTGTIASFSSPADVVLSASGTTLYVVDSVDSAIRSVNLATRSVTTLTSKTNKVLNGPTSLVLDLKNASNLGYVADKANNCIRLVTITGLVIPFAGNCSTTGAGATDGTGSNALFNQPGDLSFTPEGNLVVADSSNSVIRLINTTTLTVTTIVGNALAGASDGIGSQASFKTPQGITYDSNSSSYYISDTGNSVIRRLKCVPGTASPTSMTPSPSATPTLTPSGTPSPAKALGGNSTTPSPSPTLTPTPTPTATPTTTKSSSGGVVVVVSATSTPSQTPTLSTTSTKTRTASAPASLLPTPSSRSTPSSGSNLGGTSSSSATLSSGGIGGVVAGVLLLAIIGGVVAFCTLCQKVKASPLGGPQHQHQQHVEVVQVISSPNPLVFQQQQPVMQQPQPVMQPVMQQQQSTIVITNTNTTPAASLHPTHAAVAFGLPMVAVHHHHSSGSGGDGGGTLPPGWQVHTDGIDTWYTDPSGNSHWQPPPPMMGGGGGVGTMC